MDFKGQHCSPGIPVLDIPYQDYLTTAPAQVAAKLAEFPLVVSTGIRGIRLYDRS